MVGSGVLRVQRRGARKDVCEVGYGGCVSAFLQEPCGCERAGSGVLYRWGGESGAVKAAKIAGEASLRLVDYLYAAFWVAGGRDMEGEGMGSGSVVSPLWFHYPGHRETFGVQTQWCLGLGCGLIVAPVVEDNGIDVDVYFPDGVWHDFWSWNKVSDKGALGGGAMKSTGVE